MPEPRSPRTTTDRGDQLLLGILLIAIGAIVAAGRFLPGSGEWVVLAIGLVPLVMFFLARWDWAMIWGGIQTGAGVGVLLVSDDSVGGDGGLFLLALAGGFALVSLLATAYGYRDHRLWPLAPAGILALLGAVQLVGAPEVLGSIMEVGWPLALLAAGVGLVVRALLARRRGD
jgi:hypothetical protein